MNNFNTFHRAFICFRLAQKTFFHTSPKKINVKKKLRRCDRTRTGKFYLCRKHLVRQKRVASYYFLAPHTEKNYLSCNCSIAFSKTTTFAEFP